MTATLRITMILVILCINVSCDQITKDIAREKLSYLDQINVIGERLILTKVENEGAFLSLGSSMPAPLRFVLLALLPGVFLVVAMVWLVRQQRLSRLSLIGGACVLGGGVGNVIDRVVYGSVTDFLHMDFVIFRTGIFNMADVSIMLGIAVVLIGHIAGHKPDTRQTPRA